MVDAEYFSSPITIYSTERPKSATASQNRIARIEQTMLTVDFSAPLAGPARAERLKQMANSHSAFAKARMMQEILVKIQHSLRRMPGISAAESSEIIVQLQEVGQIISKETSTLVEALSNLTLDGQETDSAIARMSIEANLAKAETDDQAQTIANLREELNTEKVKKDQAEAEVKKMLEEFEDITNEFGALRKQAKRRMGDEENREEEGDTSEEVDFVQSLENIIQTLEEQVNKHRTFWVMRRSDPEAVARAIKNSSMPDANHQATAESTYHASVAAIESGVSTLSARGDGTPIGGPSRGYGNVSSRSRALSNTFQAPYRPQTAGPPPKFGQLHGGPPRAPSVAPHSRRLSGPWGSGGSGRAAGMGHSSVFSTSSSFNRAPSRKGFHNNGNPRYRLNDYSQSGFTLPDNPSNRPASSFGFGRDFFNPQTTPTAPSRGRYGRYEEVNRFQDGNRSQFQDGNRFHDNNRLNEGSRHYEDNRFTENNQFQEIGRFQEHNRFQEPSCSQDAAGFQETDPSASEFPGESAEPSSDSNAIVSRNALSNPSVIITDQVVASWHEHIMEFYAMIRSFVERHASTPDHARAMKMITTPVWGVLLATYYPLSEADASSYLDYHIRQEKSKACLVTRIIIDFIVNRIWVPGAWTGADESSTYALNELDRELGQTQGQPSALRQPLLDKQAVIVEGIMKHEQGSSFIRSKIEETSGTLLTNLQPLLNKFANPVEACRDMEQVCDNAWELSCKILTSRLTFDFRFPEIGSRFSSQSMLPIWPSLDPLELQAKHWRVALVTTPVVTCRNDTGNNISAHSVSLADVFCMQ